MNKKIVLAVSLFILLLLVFPFLSMFFSTQNTSGKIVINEAINLPLNDTRKDLTLVFFGYVGCVKVCTPVLHRLDDFYDSPSFAPLKPFVGVSFVNLMPDMTPDQPQAFAQSFNPLFEGVYLSQKELMHIDREFNLFFSKSLIDEGELDHSDHLYLIERQKSGIVVLRNIYTTHPINKELIISDIREIINERK